MTELRFDDQVAIVTGAGNGLGRAYALLLAARGAKVVVNDVGASMTGEGTNIAAADTVVHAIRQSGGEAVADGNDVATSVGGEALVQAALGTYGRVDVLVNNAGILRDAPFALMTPELLNPVLQVHLNALFNVTRPAWRVMLDRRYGRIVNTTSAAGLLGSPAKSNYGAAKAGVVGLTRVLAMEGADHGIKVNAIAPIAATRMLLHHLGDNLRHKPEAQARMNAVVERLDPALVAPVVAYLAHEQCAVTGEIYTAGAGQVARFFIGRTPGYYHPELSAEDVRDNLARIRDEDGYIVAASTTDEITLLLQAAKS